MLLIINTTDSEQVFIGLLENGDWLDKKQFKAKARQAEKLLPAIEKLVKKNKLSGIAVVSGPASFTALRIGVVTANALAWSLKVPVVSIKATQFTDLKDLAKKVTAKARKNNNEVIVRPFYGKEPNITLKQ